MAFVGENTGVIVRGVLLGCLGLMLSAGMSLAQTRPVNAPLNCSTDGLYPVTTALETDLIDAITQASAETCHPVAIVSLLPGSDYTLTGAHHSDPTTGDSAFPLITTNVLLEGNGSTLSIDNPDFRMATVAASGSLILQQVTLTASTNNPGSLFYNNGTLTIQNSLLDEVYSGGDGGMIYNTGQLIIEQSTLQNGASAASGGFIYSSGTATIASSTLQNSNSNSGGAIYSSGTLTIQDSTLQSGSSTLSGGLIHATGSTTIENSLLQNSSSKAHGGVIYSSGALTVRDSVVRSATSFQSGGAIYVADSAAFLQVERSYIEDSAAGNAGGAIFSQTATALHESSLLRNVAADGGGIAIRGGTGLPQISLTIEHTLFADNVAEPLRNPAGDVASGGAVDAENARLLLVNTTLTRNQADQGGAVYSSGGQMLLAFSTVTENRSSDLLSGAHVMAMKSASAHVKASIFEGRGHRNCSGVQSADFNVSDDSTCGGQASDTLNTIPYLAPLTDNGGAVMTRLPLAFSAAVNRVPSVSCHYDHDLTDITAEILLLRDARGAIRPLDAACESGAVEGALQPDYDLNDDGIISPTDAITAINAIATQDTLADVNLDGIIDELDVGLIRERLGSTP